MYAWVFQVACFPQVVPPKPCKYLSSPPYVLHALPISFSGFNHLNNIWWGVQTIKFPITWFYPLPCYLNPLRAKYSPQHPILKHPLPTFLPQCEWPSFTPIQNNRKNYSSIYLTYLLTPWSRVLLEKLTGFAANQEIPHILWNPKLYIFGQQTGRW